jgi:hypothetical protein
MLTRSARGIQRHAKTAAPDALDVHLLKHARNMQRDGPLLLVVPHDGARDVGGR